MIESTKKNELVNVLCDLPLDYLTQAKLFNINLNNIPTNGSPKQNWTSFINEAINQSQEEKKLLLNFLVENVRTYPLLQEYVDLINKKEFKIRLDNLKKSIDNESVVLFLGNKFLKYIEKGEHIEFNKGFANYLYIKLKNDGYTIDEKSKDNLFYIAQKFYDKSLRSDDLITESNKFYRSKEFYLDQYDKISKLLFAQIFNFNYDTILSEKLSSDYKHIIINNENDADAEKPDMAGKNITSLLGCFRNGEKFSDCVLTELQLINVISNVLINEQSTKRLTAQGRVYLFLGFDFEQWYVKFLLNILVFSKSRTIKKDCYSLKHNIENDSKDLLIDNFNFYFFEDDDLETVLDYLT